ncbi:MAG TPA: hypothetical protein VFG33_14650 [Kribbella sp.]|uniref:hypothetical protein n=1 Tax=Kribbella sp. TaxID=1871183 RepID=UPI002D797033|nr:hypothetical protein [Kribbella sp.]HET6294621.1 hypothetical protein [Kribbella sp.]
MRPPAAAAPAPGQEAAYAEPVATTPLSTSVGQSAAVEAALARASALAQLPPPQVTALQAAIATPAPPGDPFLATQPPVTAPTVDAVDHPDRAIRVGQIVCWQLALVAVGTATAGSRLVLILTALAAITLVLLTAIRFRGLWLYRWVSVLLAFLVRRRRIDLAAESGDTAMNLVSVFCGRTSTTTMTVREQPYGLLSRPDGASVALRVGSDAQHELLPQLGSLADSADEQPVGVSVQLILHTGVKQSQQARAWIAVRATRTSEIATDEQVSQVLANTVRRMVRRFDREQIESMPLDESDVLASIGALAHANAGRGQLRERWSSWAAGPVLQVCVRLTGFAGLPRPTAQALVDTLLGTGTGSAQTIAITVTAPADNPDPTLYDAVLRVAAAHPATLDTAIDVLTTLARSFGVEPERLDGRHASGVAATLPLGVPFS